MIMSGNTATVAPCGPCLAGPAGIEGHDDLRVRALGSASMRFKCRRCSVLWSRAKKTSGAFVWERADPDAPFDRNRSTGVAVPGCQP